MSVDLAGSTAFKFQQKTTASWVDVISHFYSRFQQIFRQQWLSILKDAPENSNYDSLLKNWSMETVKGDPSLWKSLGDELVFVKRLNSPTEAIVVFEAFKRAVRKYDEQVYSFTDGRLGAKGTAWVAGFPITNREVSLVWSETEEVKRELEDHKTEFDNSRYRKGFPIELSDFVGPSIDIGFRLSGRASRRKFIVSADLAWLLLETNSVCKQAHFSFLCDDPVSLRGVMSDTPYPTVWIDMGPKAKPESAAKALARNPVTDPDQVKVYLADFITDTKEIELPYILDRGKETFGVFPRKHKRKLNLLKSQVDASDAFENKKQPDGKAAKRPANVSIRKNDKPKITE